MVPDFAKNEDIFEQNRSKGAMKNFRRKILSRKKPIYSSLMLFSADKKYKLIYEAPDFEDILNCRKQGTAPILSNNQEESEYISQEADVRSQKRPRSPASGPK